MKRLLAAAIGLTLLTSSVAMADSWNNNRGGNDRSSHDRRNDNRNDHGRYDGRRDDRRSDHRRDYRHDDRRSDHRRDYRHDDRRFDRGHDGRRDDRRYDRRDNRRDWRPDHRFDHRYNGPRYDHRYAPPRYRAPPYYRPHGYSSHNWRRGDRLPVGYYGPRYVVGNYYSYGLRSPPRGCHWVRVNNDVVLAAITTGIVLDIAYNHFY